MARLLKEFGVITQEAPAPETVSEERLREMMELLGDDTFTGITRTATFSVPFLRAAFTELLALREAVTWRTMESAPKSKAVLVAVGEPGEEIIGEARLRSEGDGDDGWWWANESPGDYYANRIDAPEPHLWLPLPTPSKDTTDV